MALEKKRDLSHLAGTWTDEEARAFEAATADLSYMPNHNPRFWSDLESLVALSQITIDRPKNTPHPRYSELIYPFDYGFLEGTSGGDGEGIDVWVGTIEAKTVNGILATVDTEKRDSETKILLGCSQLEMRQIRDWYNNVAQVQCILLTRGEA